MNRAHTVISAACRAAVATGLGRWLRAVAMMCEGQPMSDNAGRRRDLLRPLRRTEDRGVIFDRTTAERISTGRKTEHRVPRASDEPPFEKDATFPVTVMVSNSDLGYQRKRRPKRKPGERDRLTSARPRTDSPRKEGIQVCRVKVLDAKDSSLHMTTLLEAMAEGFKTRADFFDHWRERYNEGPGIDACPVEIPVWVLSFEVDTEQRQRFLARASDTNRGYTESPSAAVEEAGEPLYAVEDEYLDRYAEEAADAQLKERRRAEREAIQKLPALIEDFADPSAIERQLRAIKRQVDSIERTHARALSRKSAA